MKKLIISFLVLSQVILPRFLFAEESQAPSIAVLPVADGDLDSESKEIAQALQYLLDTETNLKLISDEQLKTVLNYYQEGVDGITDSEQRLIQAKEQYQKANVKEAKHLAGTLISDLEQKKDFQSDGKFLQEAYLLYAISAWAFRDKKGVENDFKKILALNPLFKFDADFFPPQFVSLFQKTEQKFWNQPSGQISFDTSPSVADIYINGIKQCVTPCGDLKLPVGAYTVDIRAGRYENIIDTVQIRADQPVRYNKKLVWKDEPSKSKNIPSNLEENIFEQVRNAVKAGKVAKVDNVVLVNAQSLSESKAIASFRLIDIKHEAGRAPFSFRFKRRQGIPDKYLSGISTALTVQIAQDISDNPSRFLTPKGLGDAPLFGKRHKKITKQPAFWIGMGAAVLTGVLLGILKGGGASSETPAQHTKIKLRIE